MSSCELNAIQHQAEQLGGKFGACHTELQALFLPCKRVVHVMIKNFCMCNWTGCDKGVEKGTIISTCCTPFWLSCVYGRQLCYLMHLRIEAVIILEINATKCPSRKLRSCLPVCALKVEWRLLMMGVLMLLRNCCWCTCLIPLQNFSTGASKIYTTAQQNVKVALTISFEKGWFWGLLLYFRLVAKQYYQGSVSFHVVSISQGVLNLLAAFSVSKYQHGTELSQVSMKEHSH